MEIEVIIKYHGNLDKVQNDLDAIIEILNSNYAIIRLSSEKVDLLRNYSEIEYYELPKTLFFTLERELSEICAPTPQNSNFDLTGKGTIVAILDSGIDYTHPDFKNEDGTSRILYVWDQSATGTPPQGFSTGVEYTNQELNTALKNEHPFEVIPFTDTIGHGTNVAGIACGNKSAASGAAIIVVKLGNTTFTRTTEIMRGIKYVIDKARALNMPIAINLSFGTNNGSHSGSSLFETYLNDMTNVWKNVIVVASGNEGSAGHHFFSQISTDKTININFNVRANLPSLSLSMWKNFVDTFNINLTAPNGTISNQFFRIKEPVPYTADQEVVFLINSPSAGLWKISIKGISVIDGKFSIWLPTVEEVGTETAFLVPTPETTLTLPSSAEKVISVGGYNSQINAFAEFSGRGYTRNRVFVKPDIVAPAVNVLTSRTGGGYDTATGTSIAAPFVTSACSLLFEWGITNKNDPFLYGQKLKAYLRKGAKRDTNITYPNDMWGYGKLCVKNTLNLLEK